ncbi:MAG: hypothetical protein IT385_12885, partial [Deltaproteobacteria bacterium]|nr:hypothetical protein [Deltaproteobacteria bacterium]
MHATRALGVVLAALTLATSAAHAQVVPPDALLVDRVDDAEEGACTDQPDDCTLRGALMSAAPGDLIAFHPDVFKIEADGKPTAIGVLDPLPPITGDLTTLWGSVSGLPKVRLDGSSAGTGVDGLVIKSDGNYIRGIMIEGFDGDGLRVEGANNTLGATNYCWLNQPLIIEGNGGYGVRITGEDADGNTLRDSVIGLSTTTNQ